VLQAESARSADPLARTVQLGAELTSRAIPDALALLSECFGLDGMEAIHVLQTLRARFPGHGEAA
jgi:hypothetical protein